MSNQVTVKDYIKKPNVQQLINDVLGEKSTQFATNLVQVVNQNDMLRNADPSSVLNAAIMATLLELNLNPALGHAYIVPFNNKQQDGSTKVIATFMPGYKGLKQLAIRSGQFRSIDTKEVYEGQYVEDGSFIGFHFDWGAKISDKVIGYANRFELLNGFEKILYMSVDQINAHGKRYSKTYANKYGQWTLNFDGMAKKTVTKLNLNAGEAPLSIEMQKAIAFDQSHIKDVITEESEYIDATDQPLIADTAKPTLSDDEVMQAKSTGATIDQIKEQYTITEEQQSLFE
jgi:recombination protein RecT